MGGMSYSIGWELVESEPWTEEAEQGQGHNGVEDYARR